MPEINRSKKKILFQCQFDFCHASLYLAARISLIKDEAISCENCKLMFKKNDYNLFDFLTLQTNLTFLKRGVFQGSGQGLCDPPPLSHNHNSAAPGIELCRPFFCYRKKKMNKRLSFFKILF